MTFRPRRERSFTMTQLIRPASISAVSYTHLDVYKRQTFDIDLSRLAIEAFIISTLGSGCSNVPEHNGHFPGLKSSCSKSPIDSRRTFWCSASLEYPVLLSLIHIFQRQFYVVRRQELTEERAQLEKKLEQYAFDEKMAELTEKSLQMCIRDRHRLFVLNYAPNGMWTYVVSVFFMQNRDSEGLLDEDQFYRFPVSYTHLQNILSSFYQTAKLPLGGPINSGGCAGQTPPR